MKDKFVEFTEWLLENPLMVTIIIATALGVTRIIFETSEDSTKFYVDIDR